MDGHAVIIGGGIGGVSAAYFCTTMTPADRFEQITVIEAESTLAYHTTGRSAALLTYNYGAGPVRPMSVASGPFLADPPPGFADHPILTPRGILTVAEASDHELLDSQLVAGAALTDSIVEVGSSRAAELAPHVVFGADTRAMWEPEAMSIDVAALHQGYVRGVRAAGGHIATAHRADAATRDGSGWRVETTAGDIHADVIINAAGAWGDAVAQRAGVQPVGLTPMRRTAFMVRSLIEGSHAFPFVANAPHDWYVGPDGAQFLCSPADETPTTPADEKPREIDIAMAIERINAATSLDITSITSRWAGQRTFAPDRSMVIGPDPDESTFIWCVGQGGTGIQTSPAAGVLAARAALAAGSTDGAEPVTSGGRNLVDVGAVDTDALAPGRFRHPG